MLLTSFTALQHAQACQKTGQRIVCAHVMEHGTRSTKLGMWTSTVKRDLDARGEMPPRKYCCSCHESWKFWYET